MVSNTYLTADQLATPQQIRQKVMNVSASASSSAALDGLRKVIFIYADDDIIMNVSRDGNPGDLTASTTDTRKLEVPGKQWVPIAQNDPFNRIYAKAAAGDDSVKVLINLGREVFE